jgi:D-alanine-D-alanine ligase
LFSSRLNVALTYNVKPESESFLENLSPNLKKRINQQKNNVDTFAEWDSWDTIDAVKSALEIFHNVSLVEADLSSFELLKSLDPDIVFNIAEGFFGESREAQIPAILDMLQIPYTGSDPLTLATCLDKARTKEILSYYAIPTAPFLIANEIDQIKNLKLTFPLFVKPVWEGSSKGIFSSSFVSNTKELSKQVERIITEYSQPALIEEFLSGREFTVAILGNGDEAEVLPIVEIEYKDFPEGFIPIYSYEAKWILDTKENPLDVFSCPANLSPVLETKIRQVALNAYKTLRCRDWSRIDIRLNADNIPNIIEINPLPGILPDPKENSCFPKAARTAGLSYDEMLNKVLFAAAKRNNLL